MLLDIAFSHISQILTLSFSFLFLLSCMIYSILSFMVYSNGVRNGFLFTHGKNFLKSQSVLTPPH